MWQFLAAGHGLPWLFFWACENLELRFVEAAHREEVAARAPAPGPPFPKSGHTWEASPRSAPQPPPGRHQPQKYCFSIRKIKSGVAVHAHNLSIPGRLRSEDHKLKPGWAIEQFSKIRLKTKM